jgi:hypothetical protein
MHAYFPNRGYAILFVRNVLLKGQFHKLWEVFAKANVKFRTLALVSSSNANAKTLKVGDKTCAKFC